MQQAKPEKQRKLRIAGILSVPTDPVVPVHWRIDESPGHGIIYVTVPFEYNDRKVIAELCAMRHLMTCARPIFGGPRAPSNAGVYVTAGAIRKLQRQDSDKGELYPFSRFLYYAFIETPIQVAKDTQWINEVPVVEEHRMVATPSQWPELECSALHCQLGISRHSIERYIERVTEGATKPLSAFACLRRALLSPNTCEVSIDQQKRFQGLDRYGKEAVFLLNEGSELFFVIVPEGDQYVLVTVYKRHPPLLQDVMVRGRIEKRYRA